MIKTDGLNKRVEALERKQGADRTMVVLMPGDKIPAPEERIPGKLYLVMTAEDMAVL